MCMVLSRISRLIDRDKEIFHDQQRRGGVNIIIFDFLVHTIDWSH